MSSNKNIWTAYGNAFKKYFRFSGRSSRYDFWAFRIVDALVLTALYAVIFFWQDGGILTGIYTLLSIIPSFALWSRRLHDVNKSFWLVILWILLPLLGAFINGILSYTGAPYIVTSVIYIASAVVALGIAFYVLYLTCKKGMAEANKYGEPMVEDAKYVSRSKWMIVTYFGLLLLLSVVSVAMISAYSKAMANFKINKTADQVLMLQTNIKSVFAQSTNGYQSLSDQQAAAYGLVPQDMVGETGLFNPFDGRVFLFPEPQGFIIVYTDIPVSACQKLTAQNWGKDFVRFDLDQGNASKCEECTDRGCEMAWFFK